MPPVPRHRARKRLPKPDRRRALKLLAGSPTGCTEALLFAYGITVEMLIGLIEAANLDDEIADAALRAVFAEMAGAGGKLPEQGPGYPQVWAYGQGAVLRDTHKRRGHRWHDNWMRDIQICHLIVLACHEFGVRPTRNRAARRANSTPSGISIVVAGLARHGIHRDESSIQQNL